MLAKCPPCKYWLNVRCLSVRWLSVRWLNVPDSAPISSKRIELSCAPSTGVRQTHSKGTMQNSSTNDRMQWKFRNDKRVWKGELSDGDEKKLCYLMT